MLGLGGEEVVSSRQGPLTGQVVGSVDEVFRVRLLDIKARKTLYWMRWRRWSEERGKVKGCGLRAGAGWTWAVGGDNRRTMARSAVESDLSVYVRGGRREMCVVVTLFDAGFGEVSWEGQSSVSSTRQRLTSNGRDPLPVSAPLSLSRSPT